MIDLYEIAKSNRKSADQCHRAAVSIIEDAHAKADKATEQAAEYDAIAEAASVACDWLESLPEDAVMGEFEVIDLQWRIN